MDVLGKIKEIIVLIQSEKDIEELEYDDKETGVHIRIKRNMPSEPKG